MLYPFANYGGQAPVLQGITWAEASVAVVLVALRAYGARTHAGKLRWDFVLVALATAASLACQVTIVYQCLHGVGQHMIEVKPFESIWGALFYTWLGITLGLISLTLSKGSIIALILQVTPSIQPRRRMVLWGTIAFYAVVNIIQIIFIWLQCTPLEHVWNRVSPGSCALETISNRYSYFQGSVSVATDLMLAIWPITVVWNLKMSRRVKWAFCALMAGGIVPAAAGCVRMVYSKRLVAGLDITYDLVPFLTWSATEMWFVIILGSVPPLRPLFERVVLGRIKSVTGSSGTKLSTSRRAGTKNGRTAESKQRTGIETEMTVMVVEEDGRQLEDDELGILPRQRNEIW